MSTLLLRLAAPLQSWGVGSKYDIRTTEREPTKSGVLGMLAAALGIRRDDAESIKALSSLRFGVRVDREGKLLHDYHIARAEKNSYVTHRYYLSDAVFLCGLESEDMQALNGYEYALKHPVYPLFLGRRSCPPTLPLVLGVREGDLETALINYPKLAPTNDASRIVIDSEATDKGAALMKDVPVSYSPFKREFSFRKYREAIIPGMEQTEHDPFAELEAEYVFDKNGA
ncbi:MAG: type I-E CRISPR-associated protein Cas5/CasD [Clostridia bacterium]|nr:type I-E CRISPR-associated protein Cas5/CasD [Clostridia bacterium]